MVAAAGARAWTLLCLLGLRVLADNLALLSDTLRTFQQTGCYDQLVSLRCPHGTSISVHMAQYSRLPPPKPPCLPAGANTTCNWPDALQYSLLQIVVEACQKKRQCKFQSSPKSFGVDPCPGVRKFVEISYKCRPYEFRSKVVCEDDVVQLQCNPNSRLAVYSASFGRTEYESLQCPQAPGAPEETCLVSYATETVMGACHGKRRCTLTADAATFGNPCRPQTRMYLKAVYTCVPRKVLRENFESELDEDELVAAATGDSKDDHDDDFDYDKGEFFRESAFISPSPNQEKGRDRAELDGPRGEASGDGAVEGGGKDRPTSGALENLHVYVAMSVAAALLLLTGLVLGRLLAQRRIGAARQVDAATPLEQTLPHLAVTETAIDLAGGGEAPLFGPKAAAAATLHRWQQTDVDTASVVVAPLGLDRGDGGGEFFSR